MTKTLEERLQSLTPFIEQIRKISGVPGLSFGVSQKGKTIYEIHLGQRDIQNGLVPTSDTVYHINSLTKGLTAAAYGILVEKGLASWTDPIRKHVPTFCDGCDDTDKNLTAIDLMSMRSGHVPMHALTWQGNTTLLDRKNTIKYWNATRRVSEPGQSFIYNNWAFGVMAIVIETISGQSYADFLQEHIFSPLSLKNTRVNTGKRSDNQTVCYGLDTFPDHDEIECLPVADPPFTTPSSFCLGTSGITSTLSDTLVLYSALSTSYINPSSDDAFKQTKVLLSPHNSIPIPPSQQSLSDSKPEYCLGFIRSTLPCPLGAVGINIEYLPAPTAMPTLCTNNHFVNSNRPEIFYHTGMWTGSRSIVALIPNEDVVIVGLGNALGTTDVLEWSVQMVVQALFPSHTSAQTLTELYPVGGIDFLALANQVSTNRKMEYDVWKQDMHLYRHRHGLEPDGTVMKSSVAVTEFVGRYECTAIDFVIDVLPDSEFPLQLLIKFNHVHDEVYTLRHYYGDKWEYFLNRRECIKRGRHDILTSWEGFVFHFTINQAEKNVKGFEWELWGGLQKYTFQKNNSHKSMKLL